MTGQFSKVFLLHFDNGRKASLRIPNPILPNRELATASEVATMQLIADLLPDLDRAIPLKVLAWDASVKGTVGTPFIWLEFSEGVTLRSRWLSIRVEVQ